MAPAKKFRRRIEAEARPEFGWRAFRADGMTMLELSWSTCDPLLRDGGAAKGRPIMLKSDCKEYREWRTLIELAHGAVRLLARHNWRCVLRVCVIDVVAPVYSIERTRRSGGQTDY
jgi:hypothetical protein